MLDKGERGGGRTGAVDEGKAGKGWEDLELN